MTPVCHIWISTNWISPSLAVCLTCCSRGPHTHMHARWHDRPSIFWTRTETDWWTSKNSYGVWVRAPWPEMTVLWPKYSAACFTTCHIHSNFCLCVLQISYTTDRSQKSWSFCSNCIFSQVKCNGLFNSTVVKVVEMIILFYCSSSYLSYTSASFFNLCVLSF